MDNQSTEILLEGYLIFLMGGQEYGINVKILSSIINPIQNISFGRSFSMGRNSIRINDIEIPLIDLYNLYNLEMSSKSKDTRIIVINTNEHKAAFYTEKVKEFISFNADNSIHLEISQDIDEHYIKQRINYLNRKILIPDFDEIFSEIF